MANYYVTFGCYTKEISGCEAAWALFRQACDLAECFGESVLLCDLETGEVIEEFNVDEK